MTTKNKDGSSPLARCRGRAKTQPPSHAKGGIQPEVAPDHEKRNPIRHPLSGIESVNGTQNALCFLHSRQSFGAIEPDLVLLPLTHPSTREAEVHPTAGGWRRFEGLCMGDPEGVQSDSHRQDNREKQMNRAIGS